MGKNNFSIAVNCWILRKKSYDGIGYFTIETIKRLIRDHPEIHFQILCDKNFTEDFFNYPNVSKHFIFPPYRHPLLYIFYLEIVLHIFLRKHHPDLFLSPDGFLSLSAKVKQLPVIHDVLFEHMPELMDFKNKMYYRFFFRKFARKAALIATVSEYSKQDIADTYGCNSLKIDVVYNAAKQIFQPLAPTLVTNVKFKWSNGCPYFFFVGALQPRKNLNRLLQAFEIFKQHTGSDYKLLIAGSVLWKTSKIKDTYLQSKYKDDIIFTGRVTDEELSMLMASAFALVFVSVFEGFGVPLVEAMQSNIPVICSNITSMPEIAGDAALLVNPYNIFDIAEKMKVLFENEPLRRELIENGKMQVKKYSWDLTAKLLWLSIKKVCL